MDTAVLPRLSVDDDYAPKPKVRRRRIRPLSAVLTTILSFALAAFLLWHGNFPELGGLTMALESFLPWLGLLSVLLLITATRARSVFAWTAWLVPVVIWSIQFVPALLPPAQSQTGATPVTSFTVATQNVQANTSPLLSGSPLMAQSADLVALQELAPGSIPSDAEQTYPYQADGGTVALLSKYPILQSNSLDLGGMAWIRALNAVVQTPAGSVSVYVVHAASVRPGDYADRDVMLANLDQVIAQDTSARILMLGDFNAASTDSTLASIQSQFSESMPDTGGLGFTWPAAFPMTRPDHIFSKGLQPTGAKVLAPTDSDHLGLFSSYA